MSARNENGLSDLATRHPVLASVANKMKDRDNKLLFEIVAVNQYGASF
ncbi:hypothetical protein [Methylotenera sp.]|nr:hypothetical protein [Methylotenera sp.]MDP2072299.1 hypothetical protein [Methylotenera sp.]MDP3005098.1 hypothetical protein [Methylotenera sp.]